MSGVDYFPTGHHTHKMVRYQVVILSYMVVVMSPRKHLRTLWKSVPYSAWTSLWYLGLATVQPERCHRVNIYTTYTSRFITTRFVTLQQTRHNKRYVLITT
jgi:hypothetical protein